MTEETPQASPAPADDNPKPRKARAAKRAAREAIIADATVVVRPLAKTAAPAKRHYGLVFSFLAIVLLPVLLAAGYLYTKAQDQYASTVAFTVRSEDATSATDLLGGLGSALGGGSSHDSDILYEFVGSQGLVRLIDNRLDLREIFSRGHESDPLMTFDRDGTIEDLTRFWERMVRISYDASSGLMELRILAFDPEEARAIAEAVFDESSTMINELSAQAREDATRYASEDLQNAELRLRSAREALTNFRITNQIVDPSADIQGQMGLLNTLQAQLAEALIAYDVLLGSSSSNDPRVLQEQRRIEVIQARIEEERQKFGANGNGPGGEAYATTISEFERLTADREFAETAYVAARQAYDVSLAEAQRQSRYLAAYIRPTLAEQAEYPQRLLFVALVGLFSFLIWAISALVYYSLRDRR